MVRRAVVTACLAGLPAVGLAQSSLPCEDSRPCTPAPAMPAARDLTPPAQTDQGTPRPADAGRWSLVAYLGWAHTARSALRISQRALRTDLTFDGVSYRSESLTPPVYYGGRAGCFPRRWSPVGIEVEFIHLKVYADTQQKVGASGLHRGVPIDREVQLREIVQAYSVSHGVNLLLINLAARHGTWRSASAPQGRLAVSARTGVGPTIPHTESSVDGQPQAQYELGRAGWQVAGGVEVMLWRGVHALAEYKYTRTRQQGPIHSGTAEALLQTHHVVAGLSYRF